MRAIAAVVVCLLSLCASAYGAPASVSIVIPLDKLDPERSRTIEIVPHLDLDQPVRRITIVRTGDTSYVAASDWTRLTRPIRFGWWKVIPENIPEASASEIVGSIYVRDIQLAPNSYRLTEYERNLSGVPIVLLNRTFNAASGGKYTFAIVRPTRTTTIADAVSNAKNLPFAIIVMLATALMAALREKLKSLGSALLDAIGRLGVRRFAERSFTRTYLRNLVHNHEYLKLIGLSTAGFSRPLLERVFISLRIASYDQRSEAEAATQKSVPFESAIARFPRLAILGAPGAGKTTTLSYTLLQFARNNGRAKFGIADPLLPIFIPLRRLPAKNTSLAEDLVDRETQILPDEVLSACPAGFFERKLREGKCILLLDGLDEVVSESHHRLVAQKINNLVAAYPQNRFIVTCRIAGWHDLLPGFQVLQTQDLDRTEIHEFIEGWHAAVIAEMERSRVRLQEPDDVRFAEAWQKQKDKVATAIDVQSRKLINAIEGNQRIQAVATNPMLLSLICLVHLNRHILPRGRSLLYRECIELLTDAWDRSRDLVSSEELTYTQKEAALRQMALAFQQSGKGELPRDRLEELAGEVARNLGASISGPDFVDVLERRSGLLIERSIDVLGFSHLTLQEYLVARHIQLNANLFSLITDNLDDPAWREVILLYCGLVDDATPVIAQTFEKHNYLLAAHCIGESQKCDETLVNHVIAELMGQRGSPNETLISALAALATDYKDVPVTPQQKLSAKLIADIRSELDEAQLAIQVLGNARITQALPMLVLSLTWKQSLSTVTGVAADAIIMFGNLALPEIEKLVEVDYPIGLISILQAINTGPAARLLIEMLEVHELTRHYLIAHALSAMMRSDRIVDDLLDLEPGVVPLYLRPSAGLRSGWKYSRPGSADFLRLEQYLQSRMLVRIEQRNQGTLRINLPALLNEARQRDISRSYRRCGFDDEPRVEQIVKEVSTAARRNEIDLWRTLERASTEIQSETDRVSPMARLASIFAVGYLTLLHGMNVFRLFTAFFVSKRAEDDLWSFLIFFSLALWSIALTFAAVWWRRRDGWSLQLLGAAFSPYLVFLRRLPSLIRWKPWVSFIVFSMLAAGVAVVLMVLTSKRSDAWFWFNVFLTAFGVILFMASYYRVVLRTDPLLQLILLHPEGRELLRRG